MAALTLWRARALLILILAVGAAAWLAAPGLAKSRSYETSRSYEQSRRFEPPALVLPRPAALAAAAAEAAAAQAARFETTAPHALIVDLKTGRALFEKDADRAIAPASMTKLMTAYVAFRAIAEGAVAERARVTVSRAAAARGGSSMLLRAGQRVRFGDLIAGLLIVSGNDAAAAIAEAVAGSERAFARRMTQTARKLGMESATFKNASGLPAAGHAVSLRDLATLAVALERDFPERRALFARRNLRFNGVRQWNRNPALGLDLSRYGAVADGLKTGHTREAGYCVTATATQKLPARLGGGERRVVVALAGLPSEAARAVETERALAWALSAPL